MYSTLTTHPTPPPWVWGVCVRSVCKPLGEELVYLVRRGDLLLGVAAQVGWEAAVRGGGVIAQRRPLEQRLGEPDTMATVKSQTARRHLRYNLFP